MEKQEETKKEETKEETKKDKPKQFRLGNAKLTEFENKVEGKNYTMKSIKVSKFYKTKDANGNDEWKETDTFSPAELEKLRMLIEEYQRFNNPMNSD